MQLYGSRVLSFSESATPALFLPVALRRCGSGLGLAAVRPAEVRGFGAGLVAAAVGAAGSDSGWSSMTGVTVGRVPSAVASGAGGAGAGGGALGAAGLGVGVRP